MRHEEQQAGCSARSREGVHAEVTRATHAVALGQGRGAAEEAIELAVKLLQWVEGGDGEGG